MDGLGALGLLLAIWSACYIGDFDTGIIVKHTQHGVDSAAEERGSGPVRMAKEIACERADA